MHGVEIFSEHFRDFKENYVVIGGMACEDHLNTQGLEFRVTKDIDLIILVENLNHAFVSQLWDFVVKGGYRQKEKEQQKRQYYRFVNPEDSSFPFQLELFSRLPDMIEEQGKMVFTAIPTDEELSSLSAILMDEEYYTFTKEQSDHDGNFRRANAFSLICLKAKAYLNLSEEKTKGENIDSKKIKKHRNDVFRLALTLTEDDLIIVKGKIKEDLTTFLDEMTQNPPDINGVLRNMGVSGVLVNDLLAQLRTTFLNPSIKKGGRSSNPILL